MTAVRPLARLAWIPLCVLWACREGTSQATFLPVLAAGAGTQGCAPLAAAPATAVNVFAHASIGPLSQIAAAADEETLYWTGADGSVHELAFPLGGGAPLDTVLLSPATITAGYLAPAGIAGPPVLSGIALLNDEFLAVAEHASNTLLLVSRVTPETVSNLAGGRDAAGGFASGAGVDARFRFGAPAPLLAAEDGFVVYVGDTQNHALRRVDVGVPSFVSTLAGNGAAGTGTGPLDATRFDTPSGLAVSCQGELLAVEAGTAGSGGHRLTSLRLRPSVFGGVSGLSLVLSGNGTSGTLAGVGTAAGLAAPVGLLASDDDQLFWIDSDGGILRRMDLSSGACDCPMFVDCATAVGSASPFGGASFALALGSSGALYVLAGDTGTLFRVDP